MPTGSLITQSRRAGLAPRVALRSLFSFLCPELSTSGEPSDGGGAAEAVTSQLGALVVNSLHKELQKHSADLLFQGRGLTLEGK